MTSSPPTSGAGGSAGKGGGGGGGGCGGGGGGGGDDDGGGGGVWAWTINKWVVFSVCRKWIIKYLVFSVCVGDALFTGRKNVHPFLRSTKTKDHRPLQPRQREDRARPGVHPPTDHPPPTNQPTNQTNTKPPARPLPSAISPPVSEDGAHGQHELIVDDVRAVSDAVASVTATAAGGGVGTGRQRRRQHWVRGGKEVCVG